MRTVEVEGTPQIRAVMSDHVGVMRDAPGLNRALALLSPLAAHSDMALTAALIAAAALRRCESRGAHGREDFPRISEAAMRYTSRLADLERHHAA